MRQPSRGTLRPRRPPVIGATTRTSIGAGTRRGSVSARYRRAVSGATMADMGPWHLKPLAVLALGVAVAGEVAAVVLSLGIDEWYGVLPSAIYSLTLGGA